MRPQPSGTFVWVQAAGGPALMCGALRPFADHLFTTRAWTLGSQPHADAAAWQPVAAAVGVDLDHLVRVRQVHGTGVLVHRSGDRLHAGRPEADVIVCDDPSAAVAIQTADCVPMLLADPRTGVIAAAHAGWRGLAARVPRAAVDALAREFGSRPGDLVAAIGPCISAPSYEVGADVAERFQTAGFSGAQLARWFSVGEREDHWQFDGSQAASDQLEAAGLAPEQIYIASLCSSEYPDLFCSYRRDGAHAGRMAAVIRARPR
jgi:YfiH family protein